MSLIKAIKAQLGLSVTPSNNFVWDASADNGSCKLARGNAGATTQDIMTVDAAGKVAFPQNVQTWQNVLPSRVVNADYTNGTGQPIDVAIVVGIGTVNDTASLLVSGVVVGTADTYSGLVGGVVSQLYAKVPAGAVYKLNFTGTSNVITWTELR